MGQRAAMLLISVQGGALVWEQDFYGMVLFFSAAGQSGGGLSHSPAHLHHELSLLGWGWQPCVTISLIPRLFVFAVRPICGHTVGACVQLDCVHYRKLDYEDESSVAYPS